MRPYLVYLLGFWLLAACKSQKGSVADSQWQLIFEDEFDGDLNHWNVWESGAFNQEIQYYTGEQVSTRDGLLIIEAERRELERPSKSDHSVTQQYEYVSGRIESKVRYGPSKHDGEQVYRFAARIKLPRGHGMWPAFWTYGDPWPTQGEIDILEARGGEPAKYQSNIFYGVESGKNINKKTESYHNIGKDLTTDFHVYEMTWSDEYIEIYFDGRLLHRYTPNANNNIDKLSECKQKVVLNTAVGGWFFKDREARNYADSSVMEVDWVRVYKR
jgi:beta-glucanase (GH16 family)